MRQDKAVLQYQGLWVRLLLNVQCVSDPVVRVELLTHAEGMATLCPSSDASAPASALTLSKYHSY